MTAVLAFMEFFPKGLEDRQLSSAWQHGFSFGALSVSVLVLLVLIWRQHK